MGQEISTTAARELMREDLGLQALGPPETSLRLDSAVHSFTTLISKKWLENVVSQRQVIVDEHLRTVMSSAGSFHEISQDSYVESADGALLKVNLKLMKKSVHFSRANSEPVSIATISDYLEALTYKKKCDREKLFKQIYPSVIQPFQKQDCSSCDEIVLRQSLQQLYGAAVIQLKACTSTEASEGASKHHGFSERSINLDNVHISPCLAVLETEEAFYVLEQFNGYSLRDVITYSPALVNGTYYQILFLYYQLLAIFERTAKAGWSLRPNLELNHFKVVPQTTWLQFSPLDSVFIPPAANAKPQSHGLDSFYAGARTDLSKVSVHSRRLSAYTEGWVRGEISNFDYLVVLNSVAGRKFGVPVNHPVFPWVTDFSHRFGGYRDLSKTKYRLNKGDHQLDATYHGNVGGLPFGDSVSSLPIKHHISDVLCDITYYIYKARQTSKETLCNSVRSRWVPDEYPASIERVYSWTPDECIPEFFYDPSVFKSMHDDLADLKLPQWIQSPEEFVTYHHDILESAYVSRHLHSWIDLTFGYKLSGNAAKRAKNVHLSMVDNHLDVKNYGIVQLFTVPHPKRKAWIFEEVSTEMDPFEKRDVSASWEYVDITSSLVKICASEASDVDVTSNSESVVKKSAGRADSDFTSAVSQNAKDSSDEVVSAFGDANIDLSDLSFMDALHDTEEMLKYVVDVDGVSEAGIGSFEFGSAIVRDKAGVASDAVLTDDVKLFFCLVCELAFSRHSRTRTLVPGIDVRFKENMTMLEQDTDPARSWLKSCLNDLVNPTQQFHADSSMDAENAASHSSLLLNFFQCGFTFPDYYSDLHECLGALYSCLFDRTLTYQDSEAAQSAEIQKFAGNLPHLLDTLNQEGINLIASYLLPLFKSTSFRLPMFAYVFAPLSSRVGPLKAAAMFVKDLHWLYDDVSGVRKKEVQILEQSFLSKIISAFGLKVFLTHFLKQVLDALVSGIKPDGSPQIVCRQSSSFSKASSSRYDESESLVSDELPPYFAADCEALNGFCLERLFEKSVPSLTSAGPAFTTSAGVEKTNGGAPNNSDGSADLCNAVATQAGLDSCGGIPVFSSQEILPEHSFESVIDIDTTKDTLSEFAPRLLFQRAECSAFLHAPESTESVTCSQKMHLEGHDASLNHEGSGICSPFMEVLDRVPQEESFDLDMESVIFNLGEVVDSENANLSAVSNADECHNLDLHQVIVASIRWLVPWLGPCLATEHVAMVLLRKMTTIFIDNPKEGLNESSGDKIDMFIQRIDPLISCLLEVAIVYGDQVVMQLYLPFVRNVVETSMHASQQEVSVSLCSNLVACLYLMNKTCDLCNADTILQYHEQLAEDLFQPLIRLLSAVKPFAAGPVVKQFLAHKLVDIFGFLGQKLGREEAQDLMAPLLQQFFSCFDGIYHLRRGASGSSFITRKYSFVQRPTSESFASGSKRILPTLNVAPDSRRSNSSPNLPWHITSEDATDYSRQAQGNAAARQALSIDRILNHEADAEPISEDYSCIYETFSPSLAYHSYVLFCRVMGHQYIEKTLYNSELIWQLCTRHDERLEGFPFDMEGSARVTEKSVDKADGPDLDTSTVKASLWRTHVDSKDTRPTFSNRSPWQHLDGNWLQHWKQRLGKTFHSYTFSDRRLQTYAGHSSEIRDLYIPDNEHYFLSASRDKSVKIWLLKNHGNGTAHVGCIGTYDEHSKGVFAVQGIESKRLVASCDGAVHIWDPVASSNVSKYEIGRGHVASAIRTLPAPCTTVAVATTEGLLRLYDVRVRRPCEEWKLVPSSSSAGVVKSMCVDAHCSWIASGFSNGMVSVLDLQAGMMKNHTRVHDAEILQMEPVSGRAFISSSVDSNLRMWNDDGSVKHILKSSGEYIHSIVFCQQQLIWASSSSRIAIHSTDSLSNYITHRVQQDVLKGGLSKMAVLQNNQLYLFGTDNGNVVLMA